MCLGMCEYYTHAKRGNVVFYLIRKSLWNKQFLVKIDFIVSYRNTEYYMK